VLQVLQVNVAMDPLKVRKLLRVVDSLTLMTKYTLVQNRIHAIFSDNFDKYWSISTIFGRQKRQGVSNVLMYSFSVF